MASIFIIFLKSSFQTFEGIFTLLFFAIIATCLGWIFRAITLGSDYKKIPTFKNIVYNFLVGAIVIGIITVFSEIGCNKNSDIPLRPD